MNSTSRFVRQQTGTSRSAKCGIRGYGWMFLAMALLLMLSSRAAFAQYDTGSLVGTIHDASGAAVPNVTVTVTNDATGVATVVKTEAAGDYEVPSLRVGVYTISASATGFAIAEAKSITISVGARERIDLVMKVGAAQATTIEVSDVALQIETESSQRDQTITGYQSCGPSAGEPELHRPVGSRERRAPGANAGHHDQQYQQPRPRRRVQRQRPALDV